MPVTDLLLAGLELMGLGMSIVFGFLVLLVFVLYGMSRLGTHFEPSVSLIDPAVGSSDVTTISDNAELAAVITAAIHRHRFGHNG